MNCEFCAITPFYGRRHRVRPVEEVLDELEAIPQERIAFLDDNLVPPGKRAEERALALFKGMIDRGLNKKWDCQTSLNFTDNDELLEAAAESGCHTVFFGLEAADDEALRAFGKDVNLSMGVDAYERVYERLHRYKIAVFGSFILGADSDTPDKLRRRIEYIRTSGVDIKLISFLTPFPGTRLMQRMEKEDRLLHTDFPADWDYYDMTKVTCRPAQMTVEELEMSFKEAGRHVYSYRSLGINLGRMLRNGRGFKSSLRSTLGMRIVSRTVLGQESPEAGKTP